MFFYDWRQSCEDSAVDLNNFIIENEYDKIVLVAHSMGGLVSSGYMALGATQRDKIEKYVSYGTPYLGSVAAPMVCLTGMFEAMTGDIDFDNNDGHGQTELGEKSIILETIAHSLVKNVVVPFLAANFASVYELFPSEKYFEYIGPYLTNERASNDLVTNEEYIMTTYEDTMSSIRENMLGCNRDMLEHAKVFHRSLYQNNQHITTLVDSTYVYSTGEHTATHIVLHDGLIYRYTNYFSKNGDSLVHQGSATIGYLPQKINVDDYDIDDAPTPHTYLFTSDLWKMIFGYLEGA